MRFLISIVLIGLFPCVLKAQFANASYTSGYLAADPETDAEINSPFLAYSNDDFHWIAYDPEAEGGRLLDTKSTITGAISGGFVTGKMNFLGKPIEALSDRITALAVNVKPTQELNWIYVHSGSLKNSRIHAVHKLKDGHALLSGHEFTDDENNNKAFLLKLDRKGNLKWKKEHDHAIGFDLEDVMSGQLLWMVAERTEDVGTFQSQIYRIDPKTGDVIHSFLEERYLKGAIGWNDLNLHVSADQSIITTKSVSKPDGLEVARYTPGGLAIWSKQLLEGNRADIFPKGSVIWPSGNLQVVAGLTGEAIVSATRDTLSVPNGEDLVLIQIDPQGNFLNVQQYGNGGALINEVFRHHESVGLIGAFTDSLQIQDQVLHYPAEGNHPIALNLVLQESYLPVIETLNITDDLADQIYALRIFPNPSNGEPVSVTFGLAIPDATYEIHIYDNQGKRISTQSRLANQQQTRDELPTSKLSSGLYHLFYKQEDRIVGYGRFVLNQ